MTLNQFIADSNLQVTKFGISFIHKEYILSLKRPRDFIMVRHDNWVVVSDLNPKSYIISNGRLEASLEFTCTNQHIHEIIDFIFDHGRQQGSLDAIYQITKGILEINQECIEYLKEFANDSYDYYVMSLGVSLLYKDFVRSVKDIKDGWLSVKLALEQILVKSRADTYSYKEMLQQLDDLEALKSVGLSNKFIKMREHIFLKTIYIMSSFASRVRYYKFLSVEKVLAIPAIIITLCTLAAYMLDFELLEATKQKNTSSLYLYLIQDFRDVEHIEFKMWTHTNCELQISDFCDNGNLLQELMNKMGRSSCFTKENEEEMVSVIDKLHNNIQKVSHTIQEMSINVDQYSHDLKKAKKHVISFSKLSKDDYIISMLPWFDNS